MIPFFFFLWLKEILTRILSKNKILNLKKSNFTKNDCRNIIFLFFEKFFFIREKNFFILLLTYLEKKILKINFYDLNFFFFFCNNNLPKRDLFSFRYDLIRTNLYKKKKKKFFFESIYKIINGLFILKTKKLTTIKNPYFLKKVFSYLINISILEPRQENSKIKLFLSIIKNFLNFKKSIIFEFFCSFIKRYQCLNYRIFQKIFLIILKSKSFFYFERKFYFSLSISKKLLFKKKNGNIKNKIFIKKIKRNLKKKSSLLIFLKFLIFKYFFFNKKFLKSFSFGEKNFKKIKSKLILKKFLKNSSLKFHRNSFSKKLIFRKEKKKRTYIYEIFFSNLMALNFN
ncbi:hypothetical protein HAN_1g56 (nucleomorph) [Hemiselmis andersenii]|uniref:Uncharacterized protein n=1 Tax=Hemiselmis andersenii TaxID=464988 RepID=A9BK68_HEMAN|nr:hypothetical protein HAN_1g56 [Hemiselmis andersenii]ABW97901.1 hypothetical protein HAN_1g56 [Hemiselmis andersenii]